MKNKKLSKYYQNLVLNKNFLNCQNYYKNNETKKDYLTHFLAQKFTNIVEKIFIIFFGVMFNILYIYYLFSQKKELFDGTVSDLFSGLAIILFSLGILNLAFILLYKIGVKKFFFSQLRELSKIHAHRDSLLTMLFFSFIIEVIILGISFYIAVLDPQEAKILIDINIFMAFPFFLLVTATSTKDRLKHESGIKMIFRIFLFIFYGTFLCLRIVVLFISKIFVFIFFPILKAFFHKKIFYSIDISGTKVIQYEDKFIIKKRK